MTASMFCLFLLACGDSSTNNTLTGQVKKLHHVTPIVCPNRVDVDVSMGVMRNGVGSMSTQDMWIVVSDTSFVPMLEDAVKTGALVDIEYNEARLLICSRTDAYLTSAKLAE